MGERRTDHVKRRRHTPEQIVRKLREADKLLADGIELPEVARRWRFPRRRITAGGLSSAG
jgi:hypothetical protein